MAVAVVWCHLLSRGDARRRGVVRRKGVAQEQRRTGDPGTGKGVGVCGVMMVCMVFVCGDGGSDGVCVVMVVCAW